jgi:DNA-binding transcriptional regulator YhcF (GntR family)
MLEHIFGSKARVLLLRLFINNPEKFYFVREISRKLDLHLNSVRRELNNLESIGIIESSTKEDFEKEVEKELKDNKKYYKLNRNFIFVDELRSLLVKSNLIMDQALLQKVDKMGDVYFFLLSGIFVGWDDAPADMLVVGNVKKANFQRVIHTFERELGRPINYVIMTKQDFLYRRGLTDKFLYDLLEHKNLVLVDKLKTQK